MGDLFCAEALRHLLQYFALAGAQPMDNFRSLLLTDNRNAFLFRKHFDL